MSCLRTEATQVLTNRLRAAGITQPLRLVRMNNPDGTVSLMAADEENVPLPEIEPVVGNLTCSDYPIPEAALSSSPPGKMYMIE